MGREWEGGKRGEWREGREGKGRGFEERRVLGRIVKGKGAALAPAGGGGQGGLPS